MEGAFVIPTIVESIGSLGKGVLQVKSLLTVGLSLLLTSAYPVWIPSKLVFGGLDHIEITQ